MIAIRQDDLAGEPTRALLALHLSGMHATSPPGSVRALDLSRLTDPGVTVWTAWIDGAIVGVGALKRLPDGSGEVKSMRTHPDHLRRGVATALLDHIVAIARGEGIQQLNLETGSGPAFEPALALYRQRGFVDGPAFGDYAPSAFSRFLRLSM